MFSVYHATAAKLLQSWPTLCDSLDGSPPGSPVPGILQARILEWAAISFSNAWKWKGKAKSLSPVWLLATPWTAAYQAPPSMGFARQEYWSGLPLPSPQYIIRSLNIIITSSQRSLLCWKVISWSSATAIPSKLGLEEDFLLKYAVPHRNLLFLLSFIKKYHFEHYWQCFKVRNRN